MRTWSSHFFDTELFPVLSPMGLDPAHPFPQLTNKSLNFIVSLRGTDAFGREATRAVGHCHASFQFPLRSAVASPGLYYCQL